MSVRIVASDLRYTVGTAILLDNVSITVDAGELVGVIGPNGAGKSTLLHVLGGDLSPTAGTVEIGGTNALEADEQLLARLRSVLPQHRAAAVPFTAYEVVSMGRYPHRRDTANTAAADERAIGIAMSRTATIDFADRIFARCLEASRPAFHWRAYSRRRRPSSFSMSRRRRSMSLMRSESCRSSPPALRRARPS